MDLTEIKNLSKKINHIGFIMDGNRRWAKSNSLEKTQGHQHGVKALKEILKTQIELNIKTTTFFAFSKDNKKKRTPQEYTQLMNLFIQEFDQLTTQINDSTTKQNKKIKISVFGNYKELREDVVKKIDQIIQKTQNHSDYYINFCINYDGQYEILEGIKKIINKYKTQQFDINSLTEKDIKQNLWTKNFQAPEIIVRTGNSPRLSGFLTWDSQYSEIYFSQKMWPDFSKKDLYKIIQWYNKVERKFGQ